MHGMGMSARAFILGFASKDSSLKAFIHYFLVTMNPILYGQEEIQVRRTFFVHFPEAGGFSGSVISRSQKFAIGMID
jgi:hypothetical protein